MSGLKIVAGNLNIAAYAKSLNLPVTDGLTVAAMFVSGALNRNYADSGSTMSATGTPTETTAYSYSFGDQVRIDSGEAWAGQMTVIALARRRITTTTATARPYFTSWGGALASGGGAGLVTLKDSNTYAHAMAKTSAGAVSYVNATMPIASGTVDNSWCLMAQRVTASANEAHNLTAGTVASSALPSGSTWATNSAITLKIAGSNNTATGAEETTEIALALMFSRDLTDDELAQTQQWVSAWAKTKGLTV